MQRSPSALSPSSQPRAQVLRSVRGALRWARLGLGQEPDRPPLTGPVRTSGGEGFLVCCGVCDDGRQGREAGLPSLTLRVPWTIDPHFRFF